jgi:YidC/Oxa1 family membrane protein insertase
MIFFHPIELLMEFLVSHYHSLVGSYGISLILTSLSINIIMIPVFWYAEKLQQKERDIQAAMRPKIQEYKSVFKGYELHLYISNLHKQYNYHPVYALRSLLGLFIQLPFFVATYNFLSHYSATSGVSFLFIGDLGKPDMLIALFGFAINALPFAMTAVNLCASFVYGKMLTKAERINIYIIALFFLVLLYKSPSGLLLYWTCNNIFSFFKSVVFVKQLQKKSIVR